MNDLSIFQLCRFSLKNLNIIFINFAEFTDKITSCLHDKRYFIQKQSCDLLVNLFSKVKEIKTKNEKELILKTIESIEKLVTNGTKSSRDNLSEYEKVMPLTLIQSLIQCELSSSCYKKITEILHQSILKVSINERYSFLFCFECHLVTFSAY